MIKPSTNSFFPYCLPLSRITHRVCSLLDAIIIVCRFLAAIGEGEAEPEVAEDNNGDDDKPEKKKRKKSTQTKKTTATVGDGNGNLLAEVSPRCVLSLLLLDNLQMQCNV